MSPTLRPTPLPWARPRHELLLLLLVAGAALALVYPAGAQDVTRMCLTQSLGEGTFVIDGCIGPTVDRSRYDGHFYSNKAPGMSALALPAEAVVRLQAPADWRSDGDLRLWLVRLSVGGVLLLLAAFLVGRVAEGLAPGWGGVTLVTFALGTLMAPLAATSFDHVPAAGLGFAAFVLAWARRPLAAGLVAGLALLVEYQAAAIVLAVGAYVLLLGGRELLRYAAGVAPGALLLAAYGWIAFGAPWRSPLSYSDNAYDTEHGSGLLGVHVPSLDATRLVFAGNRGLLVVTPVVVAAAVGLWLLWRGGRRAEAAVCAAVTAVFVVANCGYFIPYGGDSPGPRFLVPMLPFLFVGLAPALARWPLPVLALAGVSVLGTTGVALTWPTAANAADPYRQSVWGELVRSALDRRGAELGNWLGKTVLDWASVGRTGSAVVVLLLAAAAFALAVAGARGRSGAVEA